MRASTVNTHSKQERQKKNETYVQVSGTSQKKPNLLPTCSGVFFIPRLTSGKQERSVTSPVKL